MYLPICQGEGGNNGTCCGEKHARVRCSEKRLIGRYGWMITRGPWSQQRRWRRRRERARAAAAVGWRVPVRGVEKEEGKNRVPTRRFFGDACLKMRCTPPRRSSSLLWGPSRRLPFVVLGSSRGAPRQRRGNRRRPRRHRRWRPPPIRSVNGTIKVRSAGVRARTCGVRSADELVEARLGLLVLSNERLVGAENHAVLHLP